MPFVGVGVTAEWLRCSVLNLVGCARVDSNPVADNANHKPTADSAVHPSEVDTSRSSSGPRQLYSCPYTLSALINKHCLLACLLLLFRNALSC